MTHTRSHLTAGQPASSCTFSSVESTHLRSLTSQTRYAPNTLSSRAKGGIMCLTRPRNWSGSLWSRILRPDTRLVKVLTMPSLTNSGRLMTLVLIRSLSEGSARLSLTNWVDIRESHSLKRQLSTCLCAQLWNAETQTRMTSWKSESNN